MFRANLAAFFLLVAIPASASSPVFTASGANDVVKLEALSQNAGSADERALAKGAALALRHNDASALAILEPLTKAAGDPELRAEAYLSVASVYLRQGRFADVYQAIATAKTLRTTAPSLDELQTMDFAKSLEGVTPMAVSHRASGRLVASRDLARLLRAPVTINGNAMDAVVDSGAGFCTLSESAAKKLGVKLLDRATSVGTASKDDVKTRLGVIEKYQVGDAVLTNVVAVVLPDSDLSFMGGLYKIDSIMGLPVFEALGRIEVAKEEGKEFFYYGHKDGARAVGNLLLAGVEPIVLVDAGNAQLRLFLDTGATHTTLNASTARDYPALTSAAVKNAATLRGAGGTSEDKDAMTLPALHLSIAGRPFDLELISMRSKLEKTRHGAIGQDILKQGARWSLDFETMSFTVSD